MFKNREVLYAVTFCIIVTGISAALYMFLLIPGIYIILGEAAVFLVAFCLFCNYRYRRLKELSGFLRKAQNQMLPLEISDQMEGELSVLKSEFDKLLTKYYAQAELLTKDKRYLADTISDISHQLKTPMTAMNIMVELLRDESLSSDKRMEFTNTLHKQMARMEWLLSAMLTMSRLDAGAIELKKETVEVADLIDKASEHLLIPMELHDQKLQIAGGLSAAYEGDLYWSSEAISNILKNCMEHTPDGGAIRIEARSNSLYAGIYIKDEGGGIKEKDLPHIFERFYKGENASPDSAGIGLALAKRLISAQNGTIDIQTIFGESTEFKIRFYHHNK